MLLKKYGNGGIDDRVAIWINGNLVYQHDVKRAWITGQDSFELVTQTKEELNHCLVKITHSVGGWEFPLRFSDEGLRTSLIWSAGALMERKDSNR